MKKILFICVFLISFFLCQAQDYDKLNLNDSLCKLIDNDTEKKEYIFEIPLDLPENFLPYSIKFIVQTHANTMVKITREYTRISKMYPSEYAYACGETIYLYEGNVLSFFQKDFTLLIDSTLIGTDELITKAKKVNPWELSVYFLNGDLIHYYSNGHGMTERDDFDAEIHAKDMSEILKSVVKEKYPYLK